VLAGGWVVAGGGLTVGVGIVTGVVLITVGVRAETGLSGALSDWLADPPEPQAAVATSIAARAGIS
jgi:hypothetical protein